MLRILNRLEERKDYLRTGLGKKEVDQDMLTASINEVGVCIGIVYEEILKTIKFKEKE